MEGIQLQYASMSECIKWLNEVELTRFQRRFKEK